MSENESHHHGKHEIIIVKKHGGHDHGHHGGAWKIAYADFMTAMMAFFLVMWLINAANEETKAAVASYFNPIKLTDSKPSEKGLKKQSKDAEGEDSQDKSKTKTDAQENSKGESADTGKQETTTAGEKTSYSEADYFENPYAVLSEIVLEVGDQANISAKGEGGANNAGPATGADGGEAYRDPFDPDFWTQQVAVMDARSGDTVDGSIGPGGFPDIAKHGEGDETDIGAVPADDPSNIDLSLTGKGSDIAKQAGGGPDASKNDGGLPLSADEKALQEAIRAAEQAGAPPEKAATEASDAANAGNPAEASDTAAAENGQPADGAGNAPNVSEGEQAFKMELSKEEKRKAAEQQMAALEASGAGDAAQKKQEMAAEQLRAQIERASMGQSGRLLEGLTVTPAEGGLLISVSDQAATPMFDVGSAVPKAETIKALAAIGKVLSERKGRVVIRGHTDALPFKDGTGDNWTLSVNRARSAYYMLTRGGLAENRVAQVSGYADRLPKVEGDPLNPKNRRIEILVEGPSQTSGG
ncbi:flagellar motor protein MotB [Rhizobium sp. L1K21]|uniref:flagellar motor protein MotB n=1 Tax=Rhizobium sp. L1K21 TaxID=2954933 RepID=UPI00209340C1|nr:flagellar motor protein MotB [Rhizobium sp. L1K21]MCO6187113.1 OmpA family protein [Rhizobium sp. L1K21]